jgi:NADH-quinone oxidoreductase subunit L
MTRVMLLTFFGQPRWNPGTYPHESPATMTAPMVMLALGSVGAGAALSMGHNLQNWLEPVVGSHEAEHLIPAWIITAAALGVVAVGVVIAYRQYAMRAVADTAPQDVSVLTVAARNDLYGDAINEAAFMRTGQQLTKAMVVVDDKAIDGSVRGISALVSQFSDGLRGLQTGFARSYALSMLAGTALVTGVILISAMWR